MEKLMMIIFLIMSSLTVLSGLIFSHFSKEIKTWLAVKCYKRHPYGELTLNELLNHLNILVQMSMSKVAETATVDPAITRDLIIFERDVITEVYKQLAGPPLNIINAMYGDDFLVNQVTLIYRRLRLDGNVRDIVAKSKR